MLYKHRSITSMIEALQAWKQNYRNIESQKHRNIESKKDRNLPSATKNVPLFDLFSLKKNKKLSSSKICLKK